MLTVLDPVDHGIVPAFPLSSSDGGPAPGPVEAPARTRAAHPERDALLVALDRVFPHGVLLLGRGGRILVASAAAEKALAAPGLPLRRGRDGTLDAAHGALDAELGRLLAAATAADHPSRAGSTLRLPGGVAIIVQPLPLVGARGPEDARALVLLDGAPPPVPGPGAPPVAPPAEAWRRRWGLTPAEARAARLLAEFGPGAKVLARGLGVSPATARTHLKRLFAKTGTHGQAALVALLRDGAPRP